MRLICRSLLLLAFTTLILLPAQAGSKPPQLLLRVHIQTAGEGLASTQAQSISIPPNGEIIQIRTLPEVTEKDLVDVKTDANGGTELILNHRGKVNLDASTGQNQGRLMVVMLNGYVIYAPIIDEQISNGILVIPHPLPPEIVKALQDIAKSNVKNGPPALAPSTMSSTPPQ